MSAIINIKRWLLVGPREAVIDLRTKLNELGDSVVEIKSIVCIVTDHPLADEPLRRVLDMIDSGRVDAL